jgi:hypothetical protein
MVLVDLGSLSAPFGDASLVLSQALFIPEDGPLAITIGGSAWSWSGQGADGKNLPNGSYRVRVESSSGLQEQAIFLRHEARAIDGLIAGPNPWRFGALRLRWTPKNGALARIQFHSLDGALIARIDVDAGTGSLDWDPPKGLPASGVYFLVVEIAPSGGLLRQSIKLSVLR